jgi:hypothetical protein
MPLYNYAIKQCAWGGFSYIDSFCYIEFTGTRAKNIF